MSRPRCARGQGTCKCGKSDGLFRRHDGDHEEADCKERNWAKTQAHNFLADQLKQFLVECGFSSVSVEHKYWDPRRVGSEGSRRVPDVLATHRLGESDKRRSWEQAMKAKRQSGYDDIEFVPFSLEVGGVWGPAARRFFDECLDAAHTDRDIDFYHWSSQSFGDFWKDALSVLMARERARIGLAASKGDWPRRIAAYARDEQEDAAAYADS